METRYELEVTRHFERLFRKLNPETARRIRDRILELRTNPYANKPLTGQLSGLRSLRIGDHRVLYIVDEENKKVTLIHIEHRRAVYR
ncbi:MAG: type II toxin-antitoxin system RelE/ParE family toxin [Crenarchaeota archaeon]|nr:type II toxin-antitoxin system RelE/ParE family toxin [Thermoproteota archaeon]